MYIQNQKGLGEGFEVWIGGEVDSVDVEREKCRDII